VNGLSDAIEGEIRRLRYLGPLRSYPPRHLAFAQHQDLNWFAGGGYAWDVVRTNPEVRRLVNAWLGDTTRLRSPYELHVRELLPAVSLGDELPSLLESESANNAYELLTLLNGPQREDVLRIAELIATRTESPERSEEAIHLVPELGSLVDSIIDIDRTATSWVDKLVHSCSEGIQDLVLIDKRTGTPVSHRDVGIGVSQVLPVLVSAYGLGNQLVAIEQPEIHLHPALQAELGDVFIGSALGEQKNTFLLETHSEHLILRVLRRIRETFEDELEDGMVPITPNDVAVLYVERASDGAKLTHIPITEDGEFERPWPEGFFPERSRELF
jgi:hypothetical protein